MSIVEESVIQELTNKLVFESLVEVGIDKESVSEEQKEILFLLLSEHPKFKQVSSDYCYHLIEKAIETYTHS
jgi:hypothetical protein